MYKCLDCGSVFDECEVTQVEDFVGYYGDARAYETWDGCPFCESTNLTFVSEYDEEDEFVESGEVDE